ncbi:MAG TPA: von Willebrand factor type A domain-containing protein [Chryseosolibacter sp.]
MKKLWVLLMTAFVLSSFENIPDRTITGRVTSAADNSPLPGVNVVLKGTSAGTVTDVNGEYEVNVPATGGTLVFAFIGLITQEVVIGSKDVVNVVMAEDVKQLSEVVVSGYSYRKQSSIAYGVTSSRKKRNSRAPQVQPVVANEPNTEEYEGLQENIFHNAVHDPLSTFSIDVDAASYTNVRRFINNGQQPPKDAVRIEEMINYFDYNFEGPKDEHPFAIHTEISSAPWNSKHKLVQIGIQGKRIDEKQLPPSNLVFLIDVSGSMADPNKLPLVITSLELLTDQLREKDHVSIVVYAGAAGVILEPTRGDKKEKILRALHQLQAGGSTAGGAGIRLAYALAKENFKEQGNNRVILCTDGDFNVGVSSNSELEQLIEEKRKEGIFLTVLGYGMGNYKDSKLEILSDKGNGNYAYIDNLSEARKVLVTEFGGTLFTIAKDVKLQIEFNPAKVNAYRLIGYENRVLKNEDFNNDKKDAGELGSGHTVTALYEIIPAGVSNEFTSIDPLKYQRPAQAPTINTDEIMTIKFRYKKPDADESKLIVHPLIDQNIPLSSTSENFRWSASVAAFGMLLRDSEYIKKFSYEDVIALAQTARGEDEEGHRAEFVKMAKSFGLLAKK